MSRWTRGHVRRRAFLRALGLGAAAAPWVPLLPSHAEDSPVPRRVIFVCFAHGVARDHWWATPTAEGLSLSPILAPLSDHAARLTVIEGLDNAPGLGQVGDQHNIAVGTLLTAMPLQADLGPGGHYLPGGPSIDRRLAPHLDDPDAPARPPLHLGVRTQGFSLSALDAGRPVRANDDPRAVYESSFGELSLPAADREHLAAQRTAARGLARARLEALVPTLPADDRQPLRDHLHALDALEASLDALGPPPPECLVPDPPPEVPHPTTPADADVPTLVRAQTELAVAALSCDLTRVITLQWGSSGNDGLRHVWQGFSQEFHTLAHLANGDDPHAHARFAQMNAWTMEQLAALLHGLAAVPQGDGTLLDHTTVVCCSGLSVQHHMGDLPVLVAGGGLSGGRVLSSPGVPIAALWLALAEHLGAPLEAFGDPEHDVGPLAGLS
ncbi:DUF1552 domain-containing protein [Paraliomyxa miuraensis]|uniref:DUF1552 domain-containing protein n=1 Tax=Paraliomyxa miuraensis TaxID=376150 RepID=UPI002255FE6C|nr:DUF1552 domain-containing protein [Paraliomyxa miuraensis]MCX4242300.1 DUF1552 domain-containing protein [Paraliomyxa miuraensis]